MAGKPLRRNVMFSSKVRQPPGVGSSDDLKGLDILLVEDFAGCRRCVERPSAALGANVAGPAATVAEAEDMLSSTLRMSLLSMSIFEGANNPVRL